MKQIAIVAGLFLLAQAGSRPPAMPSGNAVPDNARQGGEPEMVLEAESAWAGADVLWTMATSGDSMVRAYALRAIGRLEDPASARRIIGLPEQPGASFSFAAAAVAQSLNGFDPNRDPDLVASVSAWLRRVSFDRTTAIPGPIGRVLYANAEQVHGAEQVLVAILNWAANDKLRAAEYLGAVASLESLARLNAKVTTFDAATLTRLARIVRNTAVNDRETARAGAVAALVSAGAMDSDIELVALRDSDASVRRQATAVLAGAGAGLDDEKRLDLIREKLGDTDGQVRYEAVKGYVRRNAKTRGCDPLLAVVADRDTHVALAAIDALGDLCKDDADVTMRILAEAVTPVGTAWHRGAHAMVALAKRAPDRAAISMEAFASHPNWWVRMYAARAAAAAGDVIRLETLAYDPNDNVREAALGPLRRLKNEEADPAIVAALDRADVQLLRTAAALLKKSSPNPRLFRPLMTALQRLTKEGKETSRDARVALLETIAVHAGPGDGLELQPLLKDIDPVVAARAAAVMSQLTGKTVAPDPVHVLRGWPRQFPDLRMCVAVGLESGKSFTLRMGPEMAPVTVDRFLKLALVDRYYDGLTIHRVAPNFVIQGGGPGANEYSGHKEYMRDEVGGSNLRGTVGLSTRGRNTADAQFFVNLIDNPRLDADYTVFATVSSGDMTVIDAIEEGEVMRGMSAVRCSAIR